MFIYVSVQYFLFYFGSVLSLVLCSQFTSCVACLVKLFSCFLFPNHPSVDGVSVCLCSCFCSYSPCPSVFWPPRVSQCFVFSVFSYRDDFYFYVWVVLGLFFGLYVWPLKPCLPPRVLHSVSYHMTITPFHVNPCRKGTNLWWKKWTKCMYSAVQKSQATTHLFIFCMENVEYVQRCMQRHESVHGNIAF